MARRFALWAGIAVLYCVAGWVGKQMALPPGYVCAVWPPSGIALAAVLLFGPGVWPSVWLGSFVGNLTSPMGVAPTLTSIAVATAIATGAALQAHIGAWLVRRHGFRPELDRVEDVFQLVTLGGLLACLLNASIGTIALDLAGLMSGAPATQAWFTWWLGDSLGVILIAPLCLVFATRHAPPAREKVIEFAGWLVAALVIGTVAFHPAVGISFLLAPLLVWAALRFGPRGGVAAVVVVAAQAIGLTALGWSHFVRPSLNDSLLVLDTFLVAMAVPTLVLIAALTARRRAEAELLTANVRLQELDRLKTEFVNAVSHELRTPITSIVGYADFLAEETVGPLNPQQRAFVGHVRTNSLRLRYLVDDLLDVAQIEAGTFKLRLDEADLCAKAEEVAAGMRLQLREARIALVVECPAEAPRVRMDGGRMAQVLINLLSNAQKYSPEGGRIVLRVRPEHETVRVEVTDAGPGIGADDVARLFRRFSQLDGRRGGTGLGLAISKALVEAHGGTIGVESVIGQGSTFWFTLPINGPADAS